MRDRIYCRMKKGMPKDQVQKQPKIQKEKGRLQNQLEL